MVVGGRVLVAEDDRVSAMALERTLQKAGYEVTIAADGAQALKHARRGGFDALLTDWMMPGMDGIELIREVRKLAHPQPFVIMITAIASRDAQLAALEAGADGYLSKPVVLKEVLAVVETGLARRAQMTPQVPTVRRRPVATPRFVGVVIASSTGGPQTLTEVLSAIPADTPAGFFVVQHAPEFMLKTFSERLDSEAPMDIQLAVIRSETGPGQVFIAPGGRHMVIAKGSLKVELEDGPPENYLKPVADVLFRSAAGAFGQYCIAVVLTGLGHDGTLGLAHVAASGGVVLAQSPETAVMPYMPRSVVNLRLADEAVPLPKLAGVIEGHVRSLPPQLTEVRGQAA